MPNPFMKKNSVAIKGTKKRHYFSQFESIELGFDKAKKIDVLPGDLQRCRAYMSWFNRENPHLHVHGRTCDDGFFWVAIVRAE